VIGGRGACEVSVVGPTFGAEIKPSVLSTTSIESIPGVYCYLPPKAAGAYQR